jgi:hypothetical protein
VGFGIALGEEKRLPELRERGAIGVSLQRVLGLTRRPFAMWFTSMQRAHDNLSHSSHHEVGVCASFGIIDWRRLAAIGGGDTFANDTLGSEA